MPDAAPSDASTIDGSMQDANVPDSPSPQVDAGVDSATDAYTCVAETCNGLDDDCDGFVDEGLAVVGPEVVFDGSSGATWPHLVATSDRFVVMYASGATNETWMPLSPDGAAVGPSQDMGVAAARRVFPIFDGSRLIVAFASSIRAYDPTTAAQLWPTAWMHGASVLVDATSTRVSAYREYPSLSVLRERLDTSTSPNTVSTVGAGTGADFFGWWGVARVGSDELLAVASTSRDLVLRRTTAGIGAVLSDVGVLSPGAGQYANVSLAVHDVSSPIGPSNPLAVVWQEDVHGTSSNATMFAQVTSLEPFVVSTAVPLTGSRGIADRNYDDVTQAVVVLATSADHVAGRWYVVARERPAGSTAVSYPSVTRAWEVSPSVPAGRELTIADEFPTATTTLSAATAMGRTRFATRSPNGLSTRSIGCDGR